MAAIDVNFSYIVRRSFEIAWKNKYLWIFGIFSGGSGLYIRLDYLASTAEIDPFVLFDFSQIDPMLFWQAYASIMIYSLIAAVIGFLCWGAIIDTVNRVERGGGSSFATAFSAGVDNFLRILGLSILAFFAWMVSVFVLTLFMILVGFISEILLVLSLLVVIPGIIFIIFYLASIYLLATRAIVVRRVSIGDGLEEGFKLTNQFMSSAALMFLMLVGLMIGLGIGVFIFLQLPFTFLESAVISGLGLYGPAAFFVSLIIGLPYSIIVSGYLGVFTASLYTLFYFQLVDPQMRDSLNNPPVSPSGMPPSPHPPVDPSPNSPFGGE